MAATVETLSVVVKSDGISKTRNDLNQLGVAAENTEKKVLKLIESVDKMVRQFAASTAGTQAMTNALASVNRSTAASEAAMKALATSVTTLSTQIGILSARIENSNGAINNSTVSIRHHTRAMGDAHAAARGLAGSMGALWLTYGNMLPLAAGAALGASFMAVMKQGMALEDTLQGIAVKGQVTAENMGKLRDTVMELGQGIYGPQKVAEALETLILAGLNAEQAVKGVGAALNLAVVGGTSIEKAAYTLVQVGTAMGYTSDSFSTIGNVIAKTAATSMSSVESLSEAFKSASSVGVVYGVTLKDLAVNLATLSNLGIQGSAAGTAVKNFYKELDSGADRVVKTLGKVGVVVERDLKVDGKFKDINTIVQILSDNLDKFGDAGGQALQKITNERGMRSIAAMLQAYRQEIGETTNAFKNMSEEIANSAGMTEIGMAQRATSSKNLVESTINTMKTSFVGAFEAMAPSLNIVANKLKEMFSSNEFKSGLSNAIEGLSSLFAFIANNIPTIINLGIAFLGVKAAMMAMSVATTVVAGLTAVGKAIEFATGTTVTFTTVVKALQASFLPLLAVMALVTAAMALYSWTKKEALDTKVVDQAVNSNKTFIESLNQQAANLEVANKNLRENTELKKANAATTAQLALAEVEARNKQAINSAEDQFKTAQGNLGSIRHPQSYAEMQQAADFLKKVRAQAKADLEAAQKAVARVQQASLENDRLSEQAQAREAERQKNRAQLAAKLAGNPELDSGKTDIAAKKALSFIQQEELELKKTAAQYEAKSAALLKSWQTGQKVTAESLQATVMINKEEKKYASEAVYLQQLKLAKAADESKANYQRLAEYSELTQKVREGVAAEKYRQDMEAKGIDTSKFEGQVKAKAEYLNISKQQLEIDIAAARVLDEANKQRDIRNKLESATKSSATRAEEYMAQAKAMAEYGSKAKSTALDLANAKIAESGLIENADGVVAANLRKAGSFETVAKALVNITRIGEQSNEEYNRAEADSLLMFAENEKEKVKIKAESQKKIIAMNLEQARVAAASGDERAVEAYRKTYEASMQAIAQIDATTKLKMHNVELEDWYKTVKDIVDAGLEGFDSIAEGGGSIWKSMTSSFKNMFKTQIIDYIKKEFAKPFMLNVVANVAGGMGMTGIAQTAAARGGGNKDGSPLGMLGAAKNIYSAITGGFEALSSSIAGAVQSGIDGLGLSMTSGAPGTLANGVGAAGASAAYVMGGIYGGRAISGGYGVGGSGNGTVNTGTALGMLVGGPLGSLVGGMVGGLVNRAFGRKAKETTSQGIRGTVGEDGTTGESYQKWIQKGGWFRSDKKGTDTQNLSSELTNSITSGFTTVKSASEGFAKTLGLGGDALKGFSKTFDVVLTGDMAKDGEALTKFFSDLGDEMVNKLVPNLADFARSGETASQTLERLSNVFSATDQVARMLGKTAEEAFGSIGLASDKARERLVDMAGGISNLSSKVAAYASAFFTDAEKLAPLQKALSEEMDKLGLSTVNTKEQFKSVVNSLDLTTEAGAKMFNTLMDLAPTFAQVIDAAADVAKENADKVKEALDKALEAAKDNVSNSLEALKKSVNAQKEVLNKAYDQQVEMIKDRAKAEKEAAQASLKMATESLNNIKSVFDSLSNALKSTTVQSEALNKARRMAAQDYLQSVRGSDLTKATGLDGALSDVSSDSSSFFSTFEDYAMDQAKTAELIGGLVNQAGVQKTFAELTVERLNDTITAIDDNTDKQLEALKENHEADLERLDSIVENAQKQVDILMGVYQATLSIPEAIAQLAGSMAGYSAQQGASSGASTSSNIDSLYKTLLGRSADSEGMSFWTDVIGKGYSLSYVADQITKSTEYKGLQGFAVGTNYVTEDMPALIHEGERIMPKADNAELMRRLDEGSNSGKDAEISALRNDVQNLTNVIMSGDIASVGFLREIAKTVVKWDGDGTPPERDTGVA